MTFVRRLVLVGSFLILPVVALAQEAAMTGVVTDATGGVLPGVTVTAVNEATGNVFTGITDDDLPLLRDAPGRVAVATAPRGYLKFAWPDTTPVRALREIGVPVGLATDGAASNNSLPRTSPVTGARSSWNR